jgi:hypothetical protein
VDKVDKVDKGFPADAMLGDVEGMQDDSPTLNPGAVWNVSLPVSYVSRSKQRGDVHLYAVIPDSIRNVSNSHPNMERLVVATGLEIRIGREPSGGFKGGMAREEPRSRTFDVRITILLQFLTAYGAL